MEGVAARLPHDRGVSYICWVQSRGISTALGSLIFAAARKVVGVHSSLGDGIGICLDAIRIVYGKGRVVNSLDDRVDETANDADVVDADWESPDWSKRGSILLAEVGRNAKSPVTATGRELGQDSRRGASWGTHYDWDQSPIDDRWYCGNWPIQACMKRQMESAALAVVFAVLAGSSEPKVPEIQTSFGSSGWPMGTMFADTCCHRQNLASSTKYEMPIQDRHFQASCCRSCIRFGRAGQYRACCCRHSMTVD